MIFRPKPLFVLYRILNDKGQGFIECDVYDMSVHRMRSVELRWEDLHADDAGELARTMLDPAGYAPHIKELRWWVDENYEKHH